MKLFLDELIPPRSASEGDGAIETLHERTKWHRATFGGQLRSILRYLQLPELIERAAAGHHDFRHCPRVTLPPPDPLCTPLETVLANRRSTRELSGPIPLAGVSTLLHHSLRVNRKAASSAAPQVTLHMRPYPSAGGLYPIETYLIANEVNGIPSCIAHYDTRRHELAILQAHDGGAFAAVEIKARGTGVRTPLALVMTSVMQRVTAKYGARGYRMALLEAGHASQNVCLASEAMGWGSLVYASYFDDELSELVGADGVTETVVTAILIGAKT